MTVRHIPTSSLIETNSAHAGGVQSAGDTRLWIGQLAQRHGSVPEVVEHGLTGFVADSIDDLVRAVGRLLEIDRRACRAAAEDRFSTGVMVGQYEAIYRRLRGRTSAAPTTRRDGLNGQTTGRISSEAGS
jgi:hypothetical protein